MKRHYLIALLGVMFIMVGLVVLMTPVVAQDDVGASVPPPPEVLADFYDLWVASPHADVTAEAFNHWNEDDPQEVSTSCAKCHSTPGYRDFLGVDGSEYGVVDVAPAVGTTITCDACHNNVTISLTSVTFPSGVELTDLNDSSRCMVCHQGRESGASVTAMLEEAGATEDMNTVNENVRFLNIHYFAAAASLYGSEVHGGYEFDGQRYQRRNNHVEGMDTCIDCHDPHTLELKVDVCATCHEDVESPEDFKDIRMNGSRIDYDGDGDVEEGIKGEVETLQEMLLQAIQAYAEEVAGTPIAYDGSSYPYWFTADGERYATFTGNLGIATYNYQVSYKDPGQFAHNPKYHIELLFDSISMLNEFISEPIDLSNAHRNDPGHFDSTSEPYRHWDEDGEVDAGCVKCHTADGLPFFLKNGVTINMEIPDSMECSTCHSDVSNIAEGELRISNEVTFPSGNVLTFGEEEPANLCINCHQGRESSKSVHAHIAGAGVGDDEVSADLRFRNPHYFAAGATLFGSDAAGGYQYDDMEYSGRFPHARRTDTCIGCHDPHALELDVERCMDCHDNVESKDDIYMIREDDDFDPVDYDGDGNTDEPILEEIHSFQDALYTAIQAYATDMGDPISYNGDAYPYWFNDAGETYASWTPRLVRTTYNYTWSQKDPGMFAHNADYILQLLYDSIVDIGGEEAAAGFTRAPILDRG
jgi:hypothetical protein